MSTLSNLQSDIETLHARCNVLRRKLGHTVVPDSEAKKVMSSTSRQGVELALLQLREAKATELQMLSLRCCGHSTRDCHGSSSGPLGSRFNLRLMLSVADCMLQQGKELQVFSGRHETLQRENRTLREFAKQRTGAAGVASASAAMGPGQRPASAPLSQRPAPSAPVSLANAAGVDGAQLPTGRTAAASAAAAALLAHAPSPERPAFSGRTDGLRAGERGSPREAFAEEAEGAEGTAGDAARRGRAAATAAAVAAAAVPVHHRAAPALRRDTSSGNCAAVPGSSSAGLAASASVHQTRDVRMLSLQRKLDDAVAENALWKRQFALRLEQRLHELGHRDGAAEPKPAPPPPPAPAHKRAPPPPVPPPVIEALPAAEAKRAGSKPKGGGAGTAQDTAAQESLAQAIGRATAAEAQSKKDREAVASLQKELESARAAAAAAKAHASAAPAVSASEKAAKEGAAKAEAAAAKAEVAAAKAEAERKRAEEGRKQAEERASKASSRADKAEAELAAVRASHAKALSAAELAGREREAALVAELTQAKKDREGAKKAAAAAAAGEAAKKDKESAEVSALQSQLGAAEARLREVDELRSRELARRDESSRHELCLEKEAAAKAVAALEGQLTSAKGALQQAEAERSAATAREEAEAQRAAEAEISLARSREAEDASRARYEAAQKRLDGAQLELKEADARSTAWRDERAALQTELDAERRHVELQRRHREGLEKRLKEERAVRESTEVLLETRLGDLTGGDQPDNLAAGAEALQTLLGSAAATQATLEAREAVLADAFALFSSRHAQRLKAVELAAAQRARWEEAEAQLTDLLAKVAACLLPPAAVKGAPSRSSPSRPSPSAHASSDAAAQANGASTQPDTPASDARQANEVARLSAALKDVSALLRAAGQSNTSASETVAAQETSLTASIAQFSARNNSLTAELQAARQRIEELQRAAGQPPTSKKAAQSHRPPPGAPPGRRPEAGASVGGANKPPRVFDSAEYRANAPLRER